MKEQSAAKKEGKLAKAAQKRAVKTIEKAHTRDSLQALSKLGEQVDGSYRIVSQPPIVVPARDLAATYGLSADEVGHVIREQFRNYRATLQDDRRKLLERFEVVDLARKVVGVGSVGTRAWVLLFAGRGGQDPLVLQMKEAQASVLEPYLGASAFDNHGERVVRGQRLSQAAIDVFLGWQRSPGLDGVDRDFYIRQLWDWKASIDLSTMDASGLHAYTRACGWSMARAHARSGDRVAVAAYLGAGPKFDRAIAQFSTAYADQNELDYQRLADGVSTGEVTAESGV